MAGNWDVWKAISVNGGILNYGIFEKGLSFTSVRNWYLDESTSRPGVRVWKKGWSKGKVLVTYMEAMILRLQRDGSKKLRKKKKGEMYRCLAHITKAGLTVNYTVTPLSQYYQPTHL
jgi:hypothetical protein